MYKKLTLKNGLRLMIAPRHDTQAVTVMVFVPAGSRDERRDINGVSHLVEHLAFKGTARRPSSLVLTQELDRIGAEYNAYTSKDHTCYHIKAAAKHLELLFDILSDMVLHSKFTQESLDKERGVIIEEINMYTDNPIMMVDGLFEESLFGTDHPLGWLISGPKSVIASINRESVLGYLRQFYHPRHFVVSVSGHCTQRDVAALARKYFTIDGEAQKTPERSAFTVSQTAPRVKLHYKETEQVQLCLGYPSIGYGHPDQYPLTLLSIILGGNMSSRLFINVREQHGLAYFIKASATAYHGTGAFVVQAGLDKARLGQAIALILQELNNVRDHGVTQEELVAAKDFIEGKIILALEDSEHVADWYGKQELLEPDVMTPEQRLAKLRAVPQEDVQRVARQLFDKTKLNLALIGPYQEPEQFLKMLS